MSSTQRDRQSLSITFQSGQVNLKCTFVKHKELLFITTELGKH